MIIKENPLTQYPYEFTRYNIKNLVLKIKIYLRLGVVEEILLMNLPNKSKLFHRFIRRSKLLDKVIFNQNDINKNKLPYDDNFDAIYTKS